MRIIYQILKGTFLLLGGITILIVVLLSLDSDSKSIELTEEERSAIKAHKEYYWDGDSSLYFTLRNEFGQNKKLAKGFEIQCLLALSHYPELKETPIEFIQKPSYLQLASRPDPLSVLLPWKRRKYLVIISTEPKDDPILLENTPFNEQVGILGHELAHALYYQDKNSLELVRLAYNYQYGDIKKEIERGADKSAIAHGLGYQLYDFAFYVRIELGGDTLEEIEADEDGNYLSPREIASEMSKYNFYLDSLPSSESFFTSRQNN